MSPGLRLVRSNGAAVDGPKKCSAAQQEGWLLSWVRHLTVTAWEVARDFDWLRRYRPHAAKEIQRIIKREMATRRKPSKPSA